MVYLIEPNHTTCVVGFSVEHIMNNIDVIMSKLYFKHMCSYNYPYFFFDIYMEVIKISNGYQVCRSRCPSVLRSVP